MKNIFLLFLLTFMASVQVQAQDTADSIYTEVEQYPQFPGGPAAMMAFSQKNIKYPKIDADNKIEGTVLVQFVVEKDGSLTNIEVVKEPGGGLGKEATRVVSIMPKWLPGTTNGIPVRSKITVPVRFRLHR